MKISAELEHWGKIEKNVSSESTFEKADCLTIDCSFEVFLIDPIATMKVITLEF